MDNAVQADQVKGPKWLQCVCRAACVKFGNNNALCLGGRRTGALAGTGSGNNSHA